MAVPTAIAAVEKLAHHAVAAQRGEGEGRDKLFGGGGHDHLHFCTCLDEEAHQGASLIGSYAARDSNDDVLSLHDFGGVLYIYMCISDRQEGYALLKS